MRKSKFYLKLKYKLGLFVALLIIVSMLPTNYFSSEEQARLHYKEMKEKATKIAQSAGSMALIKQENDEIQWDLIRQSLYFMYQLENEEAQVDRDLLYIIVVDKNGNIPIAEINISLVNRLLGNKKPEDFIGKLKEDVKKRVMQKMEKEKINLLPSLSLLKPILPIRVELEPGGNYVGTMDICFSQKAMQDVVAQKRMEGIINTIIFSLLGIVVFLILSTMMITKPVNILSQAMEKVRNGDLNQEVFFKSHDELGMLANSFNFMTKGLMEREKFRAERDKIKNTFSKYVSPQVVDKILEENIPTGGEKKKVTVMFSDIRGFTSMAEKMEPHDVVAMLNEYFGVMVDIIFKYEGTLDKYIGDAMMAEFGAPIFSPDDAIRAVLTAIEMQNELKKLNEELTKRGKNPIYMGIGINTGEVVAGNIGSAKRMEYTVIGDNVNLASRLCGKSLGNQILISESTYIEIKKYVEVNRLEPIMVKGKSQPIIIYEVGSVKAGIDIKLGVNKI